jgi:hypothetical protein
MRPSTAGTGLDLKGVKRDEPQGKLQRDRRKNGEGMMRMKKGIAIGALAGGLALGVATSAVAGDVVKVTNGAELAAAIVSANSDPSIETIKCLTVAGCDVTGTLPT